MRCFSSSAFKNVVIYRQHQAVHSVFGLPFTNSPEQSWCAAKNPFCENRTSAGQSPTESARLREKKCFRFGSVVVCACGLRAEICPVKSPQVKIALDGDLSEPAPEAYG